MIRFFVEQSQIADGAVMLEGDDARHLSRVLRARVGDEIGVLDGSGALYVCGIEALGASRADVRVLRTEHPATEPSVHVTVAQALPKTAERLEWVLQHGTEVGAAAFVAFRSERSEAGKLAISEQRWRKIVRTAAEQSRRTVLPSVDAAASLREVLETHRSYDLVLVCDEADDATSLRSAISGQSARRVMILVGPEGGWSDAERGRCRESGAVPVSLGRRILRTETAALVALSQIFFGLGADG